MCLIWCIPPAWCSSRCKINRGLPSTFLLAASSPDYTSFWYHPVSSLYPSHFLSCCICVFFLTHCSLFVFLFHPFLTFHLPVCLPISWFALELWLHSPLSFSYLILFSCWFCHLPVFLGALRILTFSPSPFKGAGPTHFPHSFAITHTLLQFFTPWASLGAILPKHACLPACLP